MRPPTQRPRWRCLSPGCPAHTWQWIPAHLDPVHGGRDAIEAHWADVHGDGPDPPSAVLDTTPANTVVRCPACGARQHTWSWVTAGRCRICKGLVTWAEESHRG